MIKVGLVDVGKNKLIELKKNSPNGIVYSYIAGKSPKDCSGFYDFPDKLPVDLIEANSACVSKQNHIQNLPNIYFNFRIKGAEFDRRTRVEMWKKMVLKESCKKIVFMSNAGYVSMAGDYYGKIKDKEILQKAVVINPAFDLKKEEIKDRKKDRINLLMVSKNFFRDCGEQIVNSFLRLEKKYDISLTIISPDLAKVPYIAYYNSVDYNKTIFSIKNNKNIVCNPILDKNDSIKEYFKNADIFLWPPVKDHNGFKLIEPMSYGLPIISTDFFSIPDVVEEGKEGLLIPINDYFFCADDRNGQTFLSKRVRNYLQREVFSRMKTLVEDDELRKKLGRNAQKKVFTKFSYERRNRLIKRVYEEASKN